MSEDLTPLASILKRQPHYSFMRPGDFVWFVLLLIFTAWKFWILKDFPDPYFTELLNFAIISLLALVWYAWIRIRRRNCCADTGELIIAVFFPQAYKIALDYFAADGWSVWSVPFWMYALFLPVVAYRIWNAPKVAKELEYLRSAAEEAFRAAQAGPRFTHIENP
ncbi:MAG: hypothetical protein ACYC67_12660 [Prosthecobacter sp.]